MSGNNGRRLSRRLFLSTAATGALTGPYLISCGKSTVSTVEKPMTRQLGRTGCEVTTLGLGGQASIQWTPADVDPEQIILKAFDRGVTYFDTSNVYGPSQVNFGKAFRTLHLVPGEAGYNEAKRRSTVLASKTMLRHARGSHPDVRDRTNGPEGSFAVDDIKRSLSQMFGDGRGSYPEGAYIDVFQIHNLTTMPEVDAIYVGLDDPDPKAERIGALAALRDYRDGTNLTGLNPKEEKLVRHIGITGHHSSPVMMECLQRDTHNLIDTMLIAINANDRLYLNHQYNAIPVAAAKGLGLIAMKVFADGAMYTKEAKWSRTPEDVVRTVGSSSLPSCPLVEYALSTPGISTSIIGTGQISEEAAACQLTQNMAAAQVTPNMLTGSDRAEIEQAAAAVKGGQTNWFQVESQPLGAPRDAEVSLEKHDDARLARITWQTAYAGDQPLSHYEVWRGQEQIAQVEHKPQLTKEPFAYEDALTGDTEYSYKVVAVDTEGRRAEAETETLKQA